VSVGLLVAFVAGASLKPQVIRLERDGHDRPIAAVRVGNTWARLLVDTGASTHVLSRRFLKEALGAVPRGEPLGVSGLSGDAKEAVLLRELSATTRDGVALNLREPVAMAWDDHEDDGLLSPQLLVPGGVVELDLRAGTLTLNPPEDAQARDTRAERCEPYDNLSLLFVAPTQVDGKAAPMLLDTGASYTALDSQSVAGAALAPRSMAAGQVKSLGGRTASRRVQTKLEFAGQRFGGEVRLVDGRAQGCDSVGHLGIDVLGGCKLRFAAKGVSANCADERPDAGKK
jgi:predicted aspartyl protease